VKIELEKPARDALGRALAGYLKDECDVEIGGMDAVLLLDFISERLGPHYYNQALYDARAHLEHVRPKWTRFAWRRPSGGRPDML